MRETIALVERYSAIDYDRLPMRSVDMAKKCLIDYLGCTYAAWSFGSSKIARDFALENYARGKCTIIGATDKLVAAGACFTNGTTGHAAELDDCSNEGGGHPGVIVMPVALSMGEHSGLSGKDLIRCIIIGYDTFIRIGKAANQQLLFARGFHPTALLGTFGAAMTAARALNLGMDQSTNAMGIAGSFVAGNLECYTDGSLTKRLHAGIVSAAGVTAAILASKGYTGPKSILEGPRGFFHGYCEGVRIEKLTEVGDGFEIDRISFKPHACCRANQAAIDAVLDILSSNDVDCTAIRSILVELSKTPYDIVGQPSEIKLNPKNSVDGQFSAHYSVAIACLEKKAFLEEYTDESIRRQDVTELLKKIEVRHDPSLDRFFPESFPARVTLTMDDGRKLVKEVRYPEGDPENPLSWEKMLQKFDRCVANSMLDKEKKEQMIASVRNLEQIEDIRGFTALL